MSDPGRDDVWTDLESLLNRTEAEKDAASTLSGDADPDVEFHPREAQARESCDLSLPFEDLLSELLGSWSDDTASSIESAPAGEAPVEVPLSSLMARLMDEPQPDSEPAAGWVEQTEDPFEPENASASLGALHESLTASAGPAEGQAAAEFSTEAAPLAEPQIETQAEAIPCGGLEQQTEVAEEDNLQAAGYVSTEEAALVEPQVETQAEAIPRGGLEQQTEAAEEDKLQAAGYVSTEEAALVEPQVETQAEAIPRGGLEQQTEVAEEDNLQAAGYVSTEEAALVEPQVETQAEAIPCGGLEQQAETAEEDNLQAAGYVSTEEAPLVEPQEAQAEAIPCGGLEQQTEAAEEDNLQAAGYVSTEEAALVEPQEAQAEAIPSGGLEQQAETAEEDNLQAAGYVSTEEVALVEPQEAQAEAIPSSWEEREVEANCQPGSIAAERDSLAALPAEHFDSPPAVEACQESPVAAIEIDEESPALWTDDLFNALVSDEGDEQLNGPAIRDEFSSGWEALASLPAPTPPSFSETMLFEPPLPADALLNWPVMEQGLTLPNLAQEPVTFEEGEPGPEVESDDSLRRLVGQMLAEMAASAAPTQHTPSTEAAVQRATERFLSFSLAGEVYAVALAGILETDRLPKVTRVPGLPAWAIGVSNLRGAILPVIDLRRLLSLEEAENPQDGRILVVRPLPSASPAVLVVDRLEGVALLAPNELHPAPVWLDSKILPYLAGIGSFKGRLVNVLDLGRLFEATGVTGDESPRAGEAV